MQSNIFSIGTSKTTVEVLSGTPETMTADNQPLKKMEAQTADFKNEKHVPILEKVADGWKVTVGSTLHPMTEEHYIQWIELITDKISYKQFLKPGEHPIVFFPVNADKVTAREFCNVHGLWKN
ncbi:MAG: desulfoferrodoxin family protein [Lentisphaeria bacterium]